MKKVILFDFDGTIADSFDDFLITLKTLSEKYNLPTFSKKEIEALREEDAHSILKKLKIPFYKIPFITMDMKKLQRENISTIKLFKDIPQVLKNLKDKGYTLGIITSNAKENVETLLANHDLKDVFTYVYSDTSIFGKHRKIQKFLKSNKFSVHEVLYVGDEIRDIIACKKVGAQVCAVTWGYNSRKGLMRSNPDFLIDNPSDLLNIL